MLLDLVIVSTPHQSEHSSCTISMVSLLTVYLPVPVLWNSRVMSFREENDIAISKYVPETLGAPFVFDALHIPPHNA